jgi:hypothetical protein
MTCGQRIRGGTRRPQDMNQVECRWPAGKVNFNFDRRRVESGARAAVQDGDGHA